MLQASYDMVFCGKRIFVVHGKAVPETGQISIVEMDNPFKRELIWDPVAAGDWTFLGPSEFDSGFRIGRGRLLL